MGKLNITSWGLFIGAVGQLVLYHSIFPRFPSWVMFGAVLLPWLTIFTISFGQNAPLGPRRFRQCLGFAMCWYAVANAIAEILYLLIQPARNVSAALAHVLAYLGFLSFIVLIRAYMQLHPNEGLVNQ
jgi:hypothetical protein